MAAFGGGIHVQGVIGKRRWRLRVDIHMLPGIDSTGAGRVLPTITLQCYASHSLGAIQEYVGPQKLGRLITWKGERPVEEIVREF